MAKIRTDEFEVSFNNDPAYPPYVMIKVASGYICIYHPDNILKLAYTLQSYAAKVRQELEQREENVRKE